MSLDLPEVEFVTTPLGRGSTCCTGWAVDYKQIVECGSRVSCLVTIIGAQAVLQRC